MRGRRRTADTREYRGVFAFLEEDEARIALLLAQRARVVYEGIIEGQWSYLEVVLTDMASANGLAYFLGVGEPYGEDRKGQTG